MTSILTIANRLNVQQVEYIPGTVGWNKARIMRIIEDSRYMGGNGYPVLINEATYAELQRQRADKNKQKNLDRQSGIYQLSVPVYCPKCGSEMIRRQDTRLKCHQRWICKDKECHTLVEIGDASLLGQVMELLNHVIRHPEMLRDMATPVSEQPIEIHKLENEIGRALDSSNIDTDSLKRKMMECVSLKYRNIPSERNTANRLRMDFATAKPFAVFSAEFANEMMSAIHLNENGTVEIVLRNGQTIRKE